MTYSNDVKAEALLLYGKGNSTHQVAKEFGIWCTTVLNWVHEAGIARTQSEGIFLRANGFFQPKEPLPENLRPILDGMILGDLSLPLPRGGINTHTECRWGGKHLETAEAIVRDLPLPGGWTGPRKVMNRIKGKDYPGYSLKSHCLPMLTEQRQRWYPNGKKIVPRDIILSPETVYWWYVGDGHLNKRDGCVVFCTNGFSIEDVEFLCSSYPLKGWEARIHLNRGRPIIHIPRRHVGNLLEHIGPCRNPEYEYKWIQKAGEERGASLYD